MPEPTIDAFAFVLLEDGIHRRSVLQLPIVLRPCKIIERPHVARVGGSVVDVRLLMDRAQLPDELKDHWRRTPDDATIEERVIREPGFEVGEIGNRLSQLGRMGPHPVVVQRRGFVTTEEGYRVLQEIGIGERILRQGDIRNIRDEQIPDAVNRVLEELPVHEIPIHIGVEPRVVVYFDERNALILVCIASLFRKVVVEQESLHIRGGEGFRPLSDPFVLVAVQCRIPVHIIHTGDMTRNDKIQDGTSFFFLMV